MARIFEEGPAQGHSNIPVWFFCGKMQTFGKSHHTTQGRVGGSTKLHHSQSSHLDHVTPSSNVQSRTASTALLFVVPMNDRIVRGSSKKGLRRAIATFQCGSSAGRCKPLVRAIIPSMGRAPGRIPEQAKSAC